METRNSYKNIRVSPKKMRFLLDAVKRMTPSDAVSYLFNAPGKPSRVLSKFVAAALSDAKLVLKTTEDMLEFKALSVDEGPKLKRYRAGGRGTAKPIKRKLAHINIVLKIKESGKSSSVNDMKKVEPKVEKVEKTKPVKVKKAEKKLPVGKAKKS